MKKLLFSLLLILSGITFAQDVRVDWSKEFAIDNYEMGLPTRVLENEDDFLYILFTADQNLYTGKSKIMKLKKWEKKSRRFVKEIKMFGTPEFDNLRNKYKNFRFSDALFYQDVIYMVFSSREKKKYTYFVKAFDKNLKSIGKLKKVYSYDYKKTEFFMIGNETQQNILFLERRIESEKAGYMELKYKVLNKDLSFENSGEYDLPLVNDEQVYASKNGLDVFMDGYGFKLDRKGLLHFRTRMLHKKPVKNQTKREKLKKKGTGDKALVRYVFDVHTHTKIDLKNKTYITRRIADDEYEIFADKWVVDDEGGLKVFGFYGKDRVQRKQSKDKSERKKGIQGIFYAVYDKDYNVITKKYTAFTPKQLKDLFADKGSSGTKNRKAETKYNVTKKGAISQYYTIDDYYFDDQDNLYIFATRTINTENCRTDQNGRTTCTYSCNKSNATVFKVDTNSDIVWANNFFRSYRYVSGSPDIWLTKDLKAVHGKNSLYCFYEDHENANARRKKLFPWAKVDKTAPLAYLKIDPETGKMKSHTTPVNSANVSKKKMRQIWAKDIITDGDKAYYIHYDVKASKNCLSFCNPFAYCGALIGKMPKFKGMASVGIIEVKER